MKKIIFLLLACLLLALPCDAKEAYWQNYSSHVLQYGARGAIVPNGAGDTDKDASLLAIANSKAPYITWTLANGVNSNMTPQAIAAALGNSVDFFLVLNEQDLPLVQEKFPAQDIPYTEREWLEITVDRTDDKGKNKDHYSFTEYDRSFERTAHFAAKEDTLSPALAGFTLYDTHATEIFTGLEATCLADYANSHQVAEETFFAKTLQAVMSGKPSKLKKQKVKGQEWAAPDLKLHENDMVSVAMPLISEPDFSQVSEAVKIFWQAAFNELTAQKKLRITYNENAPLRLEIQVQQLHDNFSRLEPHVAIWDRSDYNYNYRKHHGDNYQDTFREERHWTETRMVEGHIGHTVSLGVVIRLVDVASGKPVYTYSAAAKEAEEKYDGYLSILKDFAKKLEKKIDD